MNHTGKHKSDSQRRPSSSSTGFRGRGNGQRGASRGRGRGRGRRPDGPGRGGARHRTSEEHHGDDAGPSRGRRSQSDEAGESESNVKPAEPQAQPKIPVLEQTSLDLSSHPLPPYDALSQTLSRFSHLRKLNLSAMEPSEAHPSGLDSLKWLGNAVLAGRGNASSRTSTWFGKEVTTLNLSANRALGDKYAEAGEAAFAGIETLQSLFSLDLSSCSLRSLPLLILQPSLKALVLSSNEITSLPTLPVLPNLNTLILSRNRLAALPATLPSSLPALKKLSIAHNALSTKTALPDFTSCTSLREVRLNGNPALGSLPEHIQRWGKGKDAKAPGLELLDLADCGLDSWDALGPLLGESSAKNGKKGLRNLNLRGNAVATAEPEAFEVRLLQAHPTIRTMNNRNLVADKRSAEGEAAQVASNSVAEPSEDTSRAAGSKGIATAPAKKKRKRDHEDEKEEPQAPGMSTLQHSRLDEDKHRTDPAGEGIRSRSEAMAAAGSRKHKRGVRGGSNKRQKVQEQGEEGNGGELAEAEGLSGDKDEEVRSDDEGGEPTYFFQKKKSRNSASTKNTGPQLLESEDADMASADAVQQQPTIETAPSGGNKSARKGEQGRKGKGSGKGSERPKQKSQVTQKGKAQSRPSDTDPAQSRVPEQGKTSGQTQVVAPTKDAKASREPVRNAKEKKQNHREAEPKPSVSELLSGSNTATSPSRPPQGASAPEPPIAKKAEAGGQGQSAVVGIIEVKEAGRKKSKANGAPPEKKAQPAAPRKQVTIGGGGDGWGGGGSAW